MESAAQEGEYLKQLERVTPPNYPVSILAQAPSFNGEMLVQQGKDRFEERQFAEAAALLLRAVQAYELENNRLGQAIASGNLALTYQRLGQWDAAEQAIADSLRQLNQGESADSANRLSVLAQVLETQGQLQFARRQTEQAWQTWEQAGQLYQQLKDISGVLRSRINQSQALQSEGRYQRAIGTLMALMDILRQQPDDLTKALGLQSLGDAMRVAGGLKDSAQVLQQSLAIAQALKLPDTVASVQLSLGNMARTQQDSAAALAFYRQVDQFPVSINLRTQSRLNQLSLLIDNQQWDEATALSVGIQPQLENLSPGGFSIDARINFAYSLIRLKQSVPNLRISDRDVGEILAQANAEANRLGDPLAESYALGALGYLYETDRQWKTAQDLTAQALQRSQMLNQPEGAYRWQWQMGRLFRAQGLETKAVEAYDTAIQTLRSLRRDVVTSNISFQLSFRQQAEEPLYRELIDLLLQSGTPSQKNLEKARQVITSLQVTQLENFLQEPCADATPKQLEDLLDQQAPTTALFYPMILPDRLEVIYKLPQENKLRYYRTLVPTAKLRQTIQQLQLDLEEEYTFAAVKTEALQLYKWILQPARAVLEQKGIKTLVFSLDSLLRGVPMAALYDGKQYLMENYALALAPDLSLPNPQTLQSKQLKVLAVGLTNPPQGKDAQGEDFGVNFSQLKNVKQELDEIAATGILTTTLQDQAFTRERFNTVINRANYPIVHLATHGQFSSDPEAAFLLTSDGDIAINDLDSLFRIRSQIRADTIELLVLSACETAIGDELAALGIAGAAYRAGARSAIASLWTLDDAFSVEFTRQLYHHLMQPNTTKAEALQQAQQFLLKNPQYEHPRYWATYVLIGNWL
jgi:CHAT domain-containing protein